MVVDKKSARSKGYAFLEMPNDDEAETARKQLNGTELAGNAIRIKDARPSKVRAKKPNPAKTPKTEQQIEEEKPS